MRGRVRSVVCEALSARCYCTQVPSRSSGLRQQLGSMFCGPTAWSDERVCTQGTAALARALRGGPGGLAIRPEATSPAGTVRDCACTDAGSKTQGCRRGHWSIEAELSHNIGTVLLLLLCGYASCLPNERSSALCHSTSSLRIRKLVATLALERWQVLATSGSIHISEASLNRIQRGWGLSIGFFGLGQRFILDGMAGRPARWIKRRGTGGRS